MKEVVRSPFCHYRNKVYRNFATSILKQPLMDDLVSDFGDQKILEGLYSNTQEDSSLSMMERLLLKSQKYKIQIVEDEIDQKFHPEKWSVGRYSLDWPVLYAAESEKTALREILFHLYHRFYKEELQSQTIKVHRGVACLSIVSDHCADLTQEKGLDDSKLTSFDESGYPYCQTLAKAFLKDGAEMLRAPSARDKGGICTPIFKKSAIQDNEGVRKFLRCLLEPDGRVEVVEIVEGPKQILSVYDLH